MTSSVAPAFDRFRLLGRSGLRVAPLALGTMTFGTAPNAWGTAWRADDATARAILDRYLDAGGNFIDTADVYCAGRSEEIVGEELKRRGKRHQVLVSTKFSVATNPNDPNAGGNGRKHLRASLEASLQRLQTDYIDVYWVHVWDTVTPVEEVMASLSALVDEGKVLAIGLSNVPAWYATKAQMLASWHDLAPVTALQLEYSLVERNIEHEFVPMMQELDIALIPWSPLANGFLTGKYASNGGKPGGAGRLEVFAGMPGVHRIVDNDWQVLGVLERVATELGRSPAAVALNWIANRSRVATTLVGVSSVEQLERNLEAMTFVIPPELSAQLEQVSRPVPPHPYGLFSAEHLQAVSRSAFTVERVP